MKYTYIKKNIKKKFFTIDSELDNTLFNVGTTFEDYENNKYVLLSDEQVAFKNDNPTANVKEVFNMYLNMSEETLDEVKSIKLEDIDVYDNSTSVNEFTYNGSPYWLDKSTRVGLMNSTTILKNAGEENTTLWLGDVNVTLPCDSVILMLSQLEIYALNCYNVTAQHKSEVNALTTIEEVKNYDITAGYPDKLNF